MKPRMLHTLLLPTAAFLAAAVPALAQDAPPERAAEQDIVVTGKAGPVDRREVTRQARSISRATDVRNTALARFEGRACPGVAGLKREYAELVVARIRMIAEDLDIPLAKDGDCSPNILIVFTEDGQADLAEIERRTRHVSEVLSVGEKRELLEEPGPVRVWSIVETWLRNGMPVPRRRDPVNIPVARMEGGQSLISTITRQDITAAMVLFDRDEVRGKTIHQLADYAAMRVFARTRDAEGKAAPDTILRLFDPDTTAPPEGLTAFDRAYLATLYEGVPYVRGISKLLGVGATLEELQQGEE